MRKPWQPAFGTPFEGPSTDPPDPPENGRNKWVLAAVLLAVCFTGILFTAGCSLVTGNYVALNAVWVAAVPIITGIATYYFGKEGRLGRKN
jgi:drug/metabolite transporter (DMT)-like permease